MSDRIAVLMSALGVTGEDRPVVRPVLDLEGRTKAPTAAIELPDGRIVTGKTSPLLGASSAMLLDALKALAGIDDKVKLLAPESIEPIQTLDGFLIVRDFFSRGQLQSVIEWINGLVDELAERLYAAGKIRDKHAGEGFYTRLTKLEEEFPGAAVLIHIHGVLRPPLADLWGSTELLELVEQILGGMAGHPVWNLRSKTPLNPLATVPWHQDTAYLAPGAEHTLQPTAWIPFIDADSVNGTLQVLRGGHRSGHVFRHRLERTRGHAKSWYLCIADEDLPAGEVVTCEMPIGSLLLINQLIPHRSTENYSDKIRWSVDLRWRRRSSRRASRKSRSAS